MLRYTVQVKPEDDYPIRKFRTKQSDVDGDIGYDKASFVFIMLKESIGDKAFFDALKLMVQRYGGKRATWDDFESVFEKVSGKDLKSFFSSWLDNNGVPDIVVDSNKLVSMKATMYELQMTLSQNEAKFVFDLPITVSTSAGEENILEPILYSPEILDQGFEDKPISMDIDPDHYVFRKLEKSEITSSLNVTMNADNLLVILPSGGENDMVNVQEMTYGPPTTKQISVKDLFRGLADEITQSGTKATVKLDTEVTEDDVRNASVLCLGGVKYNSWAGKLLPQNGNTVLQDTGNFVVNGVPYGGENQAVLVSVKILIMQITM